MLSQLNARWMWVACIFLVPACNDTEFIDRIVLVNETAYDANVQVRGTGGGLLRLPTVEAGSTQDVEEVIDQGPVWTFIFSYGHRDPVEVELSKQELIDADWRVQVPTMLEQNLRNDGVIRPP